MTDLPLYEFNKIVNLNIPKSGQKENDRFISMGIQQDCCYKHTYKYQGRKFDYQPWADEWDK